jgi:hypothetical protein
MATFACRAAGEDIVWRHPRRYYSISRHFSFPVFPVARVLRQGERLPTLFYLDLFGLHELR